MFNKTLSLMLVGGLMVSLTGCSKEEVFMGTVADYQSSQMAAKRNCQSNADDFLLASNSKKKVVMDTDSNISRKSLAGDGWCSGHYFEKGKSTAEKLYCRTNKGGGCKPVRPKDDGKINVNLDQQTPIR